jgi:hypothetical protein
MGFWLLIPGLLMGSFVQGPTGPLIARSVAPHLSIPGGQQPHARI